MTHDDLRDEGCFDDPPDLPVLPMGKHVDGTEPSEAALAKADAARQAATSAIAAGDVESALERLTEALIDAPSALLFSLRGDLLLKLRRPIAALHDAEAALAFNVNSVRALKVKGLAHRALAQWAEAAKALGEAQAIDFDETVVGPLKLCVDHAATVHKREVIAENAAKLAAQRHAEEQARHAACHNHTTSPTTPGVRHVHSELDFTQLLAERKPIIVDFTAQWCGPCRMIAPVLDELAMTHSGIIFAKVDVDECPSISQRYGVSAMPTFILFRQNGEKAAEFKGADVSSLRKMVDEAKQ